MGKTSCFLDICVVLIWYWRVFHFPCAKLFVNLWAMQVI